MVILGRLVYLVAGTGVSENLPENLRVIDGKAWADGDTALECGRAKESGSAELWIWLRIL